ncbi:glycosyltransferase family A protein [Nocardioides baculatus]|uniref:Glycosyltransferase family 2 protein n=1 Tax=Nocardioides baculatus TaxID=2801337 RepID=A0ABS1LBR7_9ACTN|nr:glycosyltransferase family A protein [Nocardioides baculatus]MBL0749125.1 glycosyltransferase family 2 protein [Nocardioides baculatus]
MTSVSIVIPCYNGGDMVLAAVASALGQTHDETQVVVVDDGSSDEATLRALDELRDDGRALVLSQPNGGPSAARNLGIEMASGEYILPLDHDDEIHADYVARAASVLDSEPATGIVYARAERFGASEGEWDLPEFSLKAMFARNVIHACSMYRRTDWSLVGGYSTELRSGDEDYDFWLKILALGRGVVRLDEILFRYRDVGSSRAHVMTHADRVEALARIFAANSDLYVEHADAMAEMLIEHQRQWDMLAHFKKRYGRIEDAISRAGGFRARLTGRGRTAH